MLKLEHARLTLMFIAAFCIAGLGGCAPRAIANVTVHTDSLKSPIPLPDRSLLEPPPNPDCTFKRPLSNPVTAEEMRMKLDYEGQCYRQAESITRDRLQQLQNSVDKKIKTEGRPSQ
jgi:hypothetical protein